MRAASRAWIVGGGLAGGAPALRAAGDELLEEERIPFSGRKKQVSLLVLERAGGETRDQR
jgi:hypothetical protein